MILFHFAAPGRETLPRAFKSLIYGEEVYCMRTEAEQQDTRKAMAFDLYSIFDEDSSKKTYTAEEIKEIIRTYIKTTSQM